MRFQATEEQAKTIMANAVNASAPMGMGWLHFQPVAVAYHGDFSKVCSLDYVQGRMVKLHIDDNGDGTYSLPDGEPRSDYQSWATTYPTYKALAESAGDGVTYPPPPPPPPPPPAVSEAHLLTAEWCNHQAAIKQHQQASADIAAKLLELLPPGRRVEIAEGVGIVVRKPSRSFDQLTASSLLTALGHDIEEFRTAIDWAAAKAVLKSQGALDTAMLPGDGRPSVVAL